MVNTVGPVEVPQIVASAGQHSGEAANSALGYKIALIRLALQKSHSRSRAMLPFASAANDSDRFTPILPSMPEYPPPSCYSELEESGFHSDEEMQKV